MLDGEVVVRNREHCHSLRGRVRRSGLLRRERVRCANVALEGTGAAPGAARQQPVSSPSCCGRRRARSHIGRGGRGQPQLLTQQPQRQLRVVHRLVVVAQLRLHRAQIKVSVGRLMGLAVGFDVDGLAQMGERDLEIATPTMVAREVVERDRVHGAVALAARLSALEQCVAADEIVTLQHLHAKRVAHVGDLAAALDRDVGTGAVHPRVNGKRVLERAQRRPELPLPPVHGCGALELVHAECRAVIVLHAVRALPRQGRGAAALKAGCG